MWSDGLRDPRLRRESAGYNCRCFAGYDHLFVCRHHQHLDLRIGSRDGALGFDGLVFFFVELDAEAGQMSEDRGAHLGAVFADAA